MLGTIFSGSSALVTEGESQSSPELADRLDFYQQEA